MPDTTRLPKEIAFSSLANKDVFQKTVCFSYLGIFWGYVHIGLSLDKYHSSIDKITTSITRLTVIIALFGFMLSIGLSKLLTKPILILDKATKEIASGNLNARAHITTGDELQSLAYSFNKMTDSLVLAQENLEKKVMDRTQELEKTNRILNIEITERTSAEKSLQHSLEEKEVLLKEIHHRVKNNLQIITSLLYLESKKLNDEKVISAFKNSQSRIKSMALVHEKLYSSKQFAKIDLRDYLKNLAGNIAESFSNEFTPRSCEYELDFIELPIDVAIPLGLIVNELTINAFKYAFTSKENVKKNYIKITAKKIDNSKLRFTVEDNGCGMPEDFDLNQSSSLGLKLVTNLCDQIDAELGVESNNGAKFILTVSTDGNGNDSI